MANEEVWLRLFRPKKDWMEESCAMCEQNPLFDQVPKKSVHWLVSRMHLREYKAGESILSMGNAGAGAVLLLSGEVSVQLDGKEIDRMYRGELFGEVALAEDLPRTADIVALEDCKVLFFLRSDLKEWIAIKPHDASRLLLNLSKILAQRLMNRNIKINRRKK